MKTIILLSGPEKLDVDLEDDDRISVSILMQDGSSIGIHEMTVNTAQNIQTGLERCILAWRQRVARRPQRAAVELEPGEVIDADYVVMHWTYDGTGTWESASIMHDHGLNFMWRIGVCDDGTFDVSESDAELIGSKKIDCFESLKAAKHWIGMKELENQKCACSE